jgi:hypothetical protein
MTAGEQSTFEMRLRAVEDRLEILNLLAGFPLSSDIPSTAYWERMYEENAVMDRGAEQQDILGREDLVGILRGAPHLAAVESGMAHVAALPHIQIDGDRAVATGYLQIVIPNPDGPKVGLGEYPPSQGLMVWRLSANRWDLERTSAGWRVTKRTIRTAPTSDALALLHRGIDAAD